MGAGALLDKTASSPDGGAGVSYSQQPCPQSRPRGAGPDRAAGGRGEPWGRVTTCAAVRCAVSVGSMARGVEQGVAALSVALVSLFRLSTAPVAPNSSLAVSGSMLSAPTAPSSASLGRMLTEEEFRTDRDAPSKPVSKPRLAGGALIASPTLSACLIRP